MTIQEIDKSFDCRSHKDEKNMVYHEATEPVFTLYGLMPPNNAVPCYHRLPKDVAASTSEGVENLAQNTAGGRLRFMTDSPCIGVSAVLHRFSKMSHMPLSGSGGFDILYSFPGNKHEKYAGSIIPTYDVEGPFGCYIYFPTKKMRYITLEFPLYSGVEALYIGIKKNCSLLPGREYKHKVPFVTYGSSITQGGCASSPCGAYQAMLANLLDSDFINLGFSGNAKGEETMANYIAGLKMSAFIFDYDHNAPTAEHLQSTHEPFFKIFRNAQPNTPVIFMNRPKYHLNNNERKRRKIIETTYRNALAAGDKNVYYIDMSRHFSPVYGEAALVDGTHPTNLGFMYMAKALSPVLKKIIVEESE